MNINKRVIAFDLLKVLACISVIIIHISSYILTNNKIASGSFIIANIYISIAHYSVPIFIMITGAFLLDKQDGIPIKTLYTKYILKIFIIYLSFGLFYKISYLYLNKGCIYIKNIPDLLIRILTGDAHIHLWYLYMLIGLYMIYPIIYKIIKNSTKKQIEYILIVLFILSSVVYSINEYFYLFKLNYKIYNNLDISIYIFYFIAGYYLYKFKLSKLTTNLLIILTLLTLIITPVLSIISSYSFNKFTLLFVEYKSVNIVILSIGIFLLFKKISDKVNFSYCFSKIIFILSNMSFGIYLIHMLVIDIFNALDIISLKNTISSLLIPIYSLIVFTISFCFLFFVKILCKVLKKENQSR